MQSLRRSNSAAGLSVYFWSAALLLGVLWLTGGASREDALGQPVVRGVAWIVLGAVILAGERPALRDARPLSIILALTVLLPLLQLVPLPPSIWQALPGRAMLAAAAEGQAQPWRPLSIVPAATINAAGSLIVPVVVFILLIGLNARERAWVPGMVLGLIAASTVIGLLQFSGVGFNNPFVNDKPGEVSGIFANRNHFALFLAFGCMVAPVWAFLDGRRPQWRGPAAFGLILLFAVTILASGSRTGLMLGAMALGIGFILVRREIKQLMRGYPRWTFAAMIAGIVGSLAIAVLISVATDRAVSIERALTIDAGGDLRWRALPTVLAAIRVYFPVGSGLGGFDPIYRIHEPFDLLALTYHNHAHNDFLEIALDAGLPGVVLLAGALLWWVWASMRGWRKGAGMRHALPRLGSAMLLLVVLASITDYPARTPMIMTMIVLAGVWLGHRAEECGVPALPKAGEPL